MSVLSDKQINEYISAETITPVLNNTKWRKLFDLLNNSNKMFFYRSKDLNGSTFPIDGSSYTPEIEQYWGAFKSMEWLEILSYKEHRRGALLKPEIEDFTSELIAIAHSAGVKFTLIPRGIRVWGYVRKSESPVFVERI